MSQPRDPSNDFVEFIQVWGGFFHEYLEGVVMYDSRNGRFTVQVGFEISGGEANGVKRIQIITTKGVTITIRRQGGRDIGAYTLASGSGKKITATRTYL